MIVLGIDPGIARMGFGVVEGTRGKIIRHYCGCVETPKTMTQSGRLKLLHDELTRLLHAARPDRLAVEKLFFQKNVRTAMKVGEARGTILLAAAECGVPVVEFSPQDVKLALTGHGNADKGQIQRMVKVLFKLKDIPKPDDAADALAIAYTGFVSSHI